MTPVNFSQNFALMDAAIMTALGDDITLIPPYDAAINTRCVLSARPGSGAADAVSWTENIWARIDVSSVIVEMMESAAPGLGKGWAALYNGQDYTVSEVFRKGDGALAVVLNPGGSATATASGWR
jgi:hypothetical protein